MGYRHLFLFLLGQVGMMALARFIFQWVLKFADSDLDEGGKLFPVAAVGAAMLGFRIFDAVTDPMAGALSDWWVGKGRTRQSLLWWSVVLPALGLAITFAPVSSMPIALRWLLLTFGLFVFFVGYTLYAIPYWSLIEDYGKHAEWGRRALSNMLGLGLIIATIVGFVVSPILVSPTVLGYRGAAVVFAIVSFACMLGPMFAAPPAARAAPAPGTTQPVHLKEVFASFWRALRHRRFVALLALLAGSQMSFTILTAAAPFLATKLLRGAEKDVSLLLGPLIFTAVPTFVIAPKLSARFGWSRTLLFASLCLGLVYCLCATLSGHDADQSFQVGGMSISYPVARAAAVFALAGPMIAVLLGVEGEGVAVCAAEGESSAVSMYFGVYNLVIKTLNGVALFLTSLLVTFSDGPWGVGAVRFMVIAAALLLFAGIVLSRVLAPRLDAAAST